MGDKSLQSCPTLCNPVNHSLPGSSVQGILQARILEWVAMTSSRESSWPKDWTHISYISCIGRQILYHWCHLGSPKHLYRACCVQASSKWLRYFTDLMVLINLRGRYYYYLSLNMKKMSEITGSRSKWQQGTELAARAQPSECRHCAETSYPHCSSPGGTIPHVYMACSTLWITLHLLLPSPLLVNTLITNTEMATLILRKVMGFCASAAKLVPNSSPLNPNLKGHLPLWPDSFLPSWHMFACHCEWLQAWKGSGQNQYLVSFIWWLTGQMSSWPFLDMWVEILCCCC